MEFSFYLRLTAERADLAQKVEKLQAFLDPDNYKKIDSKQQSLLVSQLAAMTDYLRVLDERIADLKATNTVA